MYASNKEKGMKLKMKIFKNILKKILLTKTIRNIYKIQLIGNLGNIVEEDDKLICYINKNKIKKDKYGYYNIYCDGITKNNKNIAKIFNLNKPVHYIIENINLNDKQVYIHNYNNNCSITIKNCNFEQGCKIYSNCDCNIDSTHIKALNLLLIQAKKLTLKNMNLTNEFSRTNSDLNIILDANKNINLINSNIGEENKKIKISITSKTIELTNSTINGDEIECKSKNIITDNKSSLNGTNKVTITTDKINKINISSNTIIYNDKVFKQDKKKKVTIETKNDDLTNKRLELINLLKNLKTTCENTKIKNIINKPFSKTKKRL